MLLLLGVFISLHWNSQTHASVDCVRGRERSNRVIETANILTNNNYISYMSIE